MSAKTWTAAEIRALGARIPGPLAMEILYGVGRTKAHQILRSGEAGVKVIRVPGTNRTVVPTSAILRALADHAEAP